MNKFAIAFIAALAGFLITIAPVRAESYRLNCDYWQRPIEEVARDVEMRGVTPEVALVAVLAVQNALDKAPEVCN